MRKDPFQPQGNRDVLTNIGVGGARQLDHLYQPAQAVMRQGGVCRFQRDIRSASHRNTYRGGFHCGGVVNAVTPPSPAGRAD
ncbi:Uncharacterised protein [Citrobacter koseri]|nr:Uncharacterised protein [Citrobacter koseri]